MSTPCRCPLEIKDTLSTRLGCQDKSVGCSTSLEFEQGFWVLDLQFTIGWGSSVLESQLQHISRLGRILYAIVFYEVHT